MSLNQKTMSWRNKRFDFGLLLKDIFPPNDIHPRLKYLFKQAYNVAIESGLAVEKILREYEGPLDVRLNLKITIINNLNYQTKSVEEVDNYPGAYFWVIRHFLSLLPSPLLPEYDGGMYCLNFNELAIKCHKFMRSYYESEHKNVCQLDCDMARYVDALPLENQLLLIVLIVFIRKLSLKPICHRQVSRSTLIILTKYFCPCVGNRAPTPELEKETYNNTFSVFFYMLVRWRYIAKNARNIGYEVDFFQPERPNTKSCCRPPSRDVSVQTTMRLPDVPPWGGCDYVQDATSQTDASDFAPEGIGVPGWGKIEPIYMNLTKRTALSNNTGGSLKRVNRPVDRPPPVPDCSGTGTIPKVLQQKREMVCLRDTAAQIKALRDKRFTCPTPTVHDYENILDMADVASSSTLGRAKKNKSENRGLSKRVSFSEKTSTIENTNSQMDRSESLSLEKCQRKLDESEMYFRHSYYRFGDVFDEACGFKINEEEENDEEDDKDTFSSSSTEIYVPPKITDLDEIKCVVDEKPKEKSKGKKRFNLNLKRFKFNLSFLRRKTSKKPPRR